MSLPSSPTLQPSSTAADEGGGPEAQPSEDEIDGTETPTLPLTPTETAEESWETHHGGEVLIPSHTARQAYDNPFENDAFMDFPAPPEGGEDHDNGREATEQQHLEEGQSLTTTGSTPTAASTELGGWLSLVQRIETQHIRTPTTIPTTRGPPVDFDVNDWVFNLNDTVEFPTHQNPLMEKTICQHRDAQGQHCNYMTGKHYRNKCPHCGGWYCIRHLSILGTSRTEDPDNYLPGHHCRHKQPPARPLEWDTDVAATESKHTKSIRDYHHGKADEAHRQILSAIHHKSCIPDGNPTTTTTTASVAKYVEAQRGIQEMHTLMENTYHSTYKALRAIPLILQYRRDNNMPTAEDTNSITSPGTKQK